MNESMTNELQALRARAYGPDADLHLDPVGVNRLRELEKIARGADSVEPAPRSKEPDPPQSQPTAETRAPDDSNPAAAAEGVEAAKDPRPRRGSTTRAVVALTAILAVTVAVTAAVTAAVSQRIQADPRQVAVLSIDSGARLPEMFQNWQCSDGQCTPNEEVPGDVFTQFYGLTTFTVPGGFMGSSDDSLCLTIVESSAMSTEGDSWSGPIYTGCGAGDFPATIQLPVSPRLPQELRDAFPEGTGLQFILEGDEVVVLSDIADRSP